MSPHRCSARPPRGLSQCAGSRGAAACHTARARPRPRRRPCWAASRAAAGCWTAWRWRTALRSPRTAAGTACDARRLSRGSAAALGADMQAPLQGRAGMRRRGWAPAAQQLAGRAERKVGRGSLARQRQRAPDHRAQHCRSVQASHSLQSSMSHTAQSVSCPTNYARASRCSLQSLQHFCMGTVFLACNPLAPVPTPQASESTVMASAWPSAPPPASPTMLFRHTKVQLNRPPSRRAATAAP